MQPSSTLPPPASDNEIIESAPPSLVGNDSAVPADTCVPAFDQIKRRDLNELHDYSWWPQSLRLFLTNVLVLNWGFPWIRMELGGKRLIPSFTSLTARVLNRFFSSFEQQPQQIIDLCAGSGGPWQVLVEAMPESLKQVTLTDLYPPEEVQHAAPDEDGSHVRFGDGMVRYHRLSVDATMVPSELQGARTLFGCFHHFTPGLAKSILQDCIDNRAPVVVIETCDRSPIQMIGAACLMTPLAFVTPLIYFKQTPWWLFVFTYLIPVVPLIVCYDGVVSCMRAYKPAEMLAVAQSAEQADTYEWQAGKESFFGLFALTYMTGKPLAVA